MTINIILEDFRQNKMIQKFDNYTKLIGIRFKLIFIKKNYTK
jgi:hypothetical protein